MKNTSGSMATDLFAVFEGGALVNGKANITAVNANKREGSVRLNAHLSTGSITSYTVYLSLSCLYSKEQYCSTYLACIITSNQLFLPNIPQKLIKNPDMKLKFKLHISWALLPLLTSTLFT